MLKFLIGFALCVSVVQAGQAVADFKQRLQEAEDKYGPLNSSYVINATSEVGLAKTKAAADAVQKKYCALCDQQWAAWARAQILARDQALEREPRSRAQILAMYGPAKENAYASVLAYMARINHLTWEAGQASAGKPVTAVKFNAALTKVVGNEIELVTQVNGPIYVSAISLQVGEPSAVGLTPDVARPAGAPGSKVKQRWKCTLKNAKRGRYHGTASFGSASATPGTPSAGFDIEL